jgi:phospholipid/cholesterol/gamma-HCH transport system substrate-binding protein
VSEFQLYEKSQVTVLVNINLKIQEYIRKDVKIKINTDRLIGNKILVIYGSSSKAGEINIGDTLKAEKTFSSEDMINMLQKNNRHILAISSDFKSISSVLAASESTIGKLLKDEEIYEHVLLYWKKHPHIWLRG